MSEIKKIGLKYCGGCKSEYDLVQTLASISERLKGKIEFVPHSDREASGTLIVAGCATVCVDRTPFAGCPIWTITNPREAELFVELIQSMHKESYDTAENSPSYCAP